MAEKDLTLAPLKVSPYKHQQQAIKFACRMFGISEQKRKTSGVPIDERATAEYRRAIKGLRLVK